MQSLSIQTILRRSLGAIFLIFLSISALFIVSNIKGRDFHSLLLPIAFLVFCSALWWSYKYATIKIILVTLILIEILIYIPIGFFSGSFAFSSFLLNWFSGINLYITLPWIIASVIGFLLNSARRRIN